MTANRIEPGHDLSPVEIDAIEDRLDSHNRSATGRHDSQGMGFVIRDRARRTIAVAAGHSWAGIAELKQMWVDEAYEAGAMPGSCSTLLSLRPQVAAFADLGVEL